MPEAPDLEVIKDFLNDTSPASRWSGPRCCVHGPSVLASEEFATDVVGRRFGAIKRQGRRSRSRWSRTASRSSTPCSPVRFSTAPKHQDH